MSSKSVPQILEILFQNGNVYIFSPHDILFSRYVQLKSSFFAEKTSAGESEIHFSREAIKV